jgi:hypothetical protein
MMQNLTQENLKNKQVKDLEFEVSVMWKVRIKTVLVVIGVLGTTEEGLYQNLHLSSFHPSVIVLQITLMSTAHIIRKVLMFC